LKSASQKIYKQGYLITNKIHLGVLRTKAQKHVKNFEHLKMYVLRETFEMDFAVALTFSLTQPNCSVQKNENTTDNQ
jgi:hypothetical protein